MPWSRDDPCLVDGFFNQCEFRKGSARYLEIETKSIDGNYSKSGINDSVYHELRGLSLNCLSRRAPSFALLPYLFGICIFAIYS